MSKASKASLLPKPPKGYHNEDKFVSPIIRTQKTPNHTQNETQISAIDEGDEEDETMLESSQVDVPQGSKGKKKTKECVLSLSASGLDQIDSNIQMDELAHQTSTLDITQSFSAKRRKTWSTSSSSWDFGTPLARPKHFYRMPQNVIFLTLK